MYSLDVGSLFESWENEPSNFSVFTFERKTSLLCSQLGLTSSRLASSSGSNQVCLLIDCFMLSGHLILKLSEFIRIVTWIFQMWHSSPFKTFFLTFLIHPQSVAFMKANTVQQRPSLRLYSVGSRPLNFHFFSQFMSFRKILNSSKLLLKSSGRSLGPWFFSNGNMKGPFVGFKA